MTDILDELREACVGHPHAKIPWPHRLLHGAVAEIERLRAERPPAAPEAREIAEAALTYALRDHRDPPTALGPSDHQSLQLAFAAGARWVIERAAAQQVTPPWQPIETAPKDVPLLLWAPRERLWEPPFDNDLKCDEMRVSTTRHWTWATHWMPLPAPPEAREGEQS